MNNKKANYDEREYLNRSNRFKLKKQKVDDQYTKRKQKTKVRIEKLKADTQYTKQQQKNSRAIRKDKS
ncbi:hypothetical protein FACS1894166_04820 [Bacilli bacterium]|nr:hypothetical protein FACS1894166_04820 [Bacilli bacterium]